MNKAEFIEQFTNYYNIDLKTESNRTRIKYMSKWLENKEEFEKLLDKVLTSFTPTSINPYPLLPHLTEAYDSLNIIPECVRRMGEKNVIS